MLNRREETVQNRRERGWRENSQSYTENGETKVGRRTVCALCVSSSRVVGNEDLGKQDRG